MSSQQGPSPLSLLIVGQLEEFQLTQAKMVQIKPSRVDAKLLYQSLLKKFPNFLSLMNNTIISGKHKPKYTLFDLFSNIMIKGIVFETNLKLPFNCNCSHICEKYYGIADDVIADGISNLSTDNEIQIYLSNLLIKIVDKGLDIELFEIIIVAFKLPIDFTFECLATSNNHLGNLLMFSAMNANLDCLKMLLSYGMCNQVMPDGLDILDYANLSDNQQVIAFAKTLI
jgi:hypothetical protein